MDAERLAEIDAAFPRPSLSSRPEPSVIHELRDHIDALQAENERLREVVVASNTDSLAIMRIAEARITELEGLLGDVRRTMKTVGVDWFPVRLSAALPTPPTLGERIDAALSRSDAAPSAVSAARTASGSEAASE